jgi:hypothetical protein
MRFFPAICAAILLAIPASAQTPDAIQKPARTVRGQALVSQQDPALTLEFDKAFQYAGSQRFTLYGVADAEQHFFVDVAKDGTIKRLYWVQFEAYLPSNGHTYNYTDPQVEFAGLKWFARGGASSSNPAGLRPDSDRARAIALLTAKGWKIPAEVLTQRLVTMTDDTRRKELMIIYAEDLAPTGFKAADLRPGGSAETKSVQLMEKLLEHAKAGIRISK